MAITIDIDTARPYQVHVGTFLLEQAGPLVRATAGGTKAVIVTDTNVGPCSTRCPLSRAWRRQATR